MKSWLTLMLLGVLCGGQAATFYLVSRGGEKVFQPILANPYPQADLYLVDEESGAWLVDDRVMTTNAAGQKIDVESVRKELVAHLAESRAHAARRNVDESGCCFTAGTNAKSVYEHQLDQCCRRH